MADSGNIRAKKVLPFFEAFYYAIDSIVRQAKKNESIKFNFKFIIVGCPVNIESLESVVKNANKNAHKEAIYQDHRVKALKEKNVSVLDPITCMNFTDIKGAENSEKLKVFK